MMTRVFVYEYISGGETEADAMPQLLGQGRAMRDAMIADLARIGDVSVTCAVLPGEPLPACRGTSKVVCCMRAPDEDAPAFVRRQAACHDVSWIVAPESDGVLLGLHYMVGEARWLGCDAGAIALATSKRATAQHFGALGIAATRPWDDGQARQPEAGRWVVKPDDGAGSVATHAYDGFDAAHEAWLRRLAGGEPVVLEPWVEGEPISLSLLCGPGEVELLSVNRQRIRIDARGQVHDDGVLPNAIERNGRAGQLLAELAGRLRGGMPGLRGFVGIDLVWHPERGPVVIEVNPRVTCAYAGLSAALGRNLACELLAGHQVRAERLETDGASHGR
ncbi:ATP-grasp domain-containing protein [Cupriavidus sp. IK-TO18]|uniref:ATP-grasp domain-containing protein n=1 Tax=Cupriavidus sp. IK-TO18 TaxID=2782182 RepID=UPI0021048FFF|nr:ATP-grasp domain-containing protein [Cupriavidus sp. IK-TO18]